MESLFPEIVSTLPLFSAWHVYRYIVAPNPLTFSRILANMALLHIHHELEPYFVRIAALVRYPQCICTGSYM